MNNIEMKIFNMLSDGIITAEEASILLKETGEEDEKTVLLKYLGKDGSTVNINIPVELINNVLTEGLAKISKRFKAIGVKKENEEQGETSNDELIKNILKMIK